MKIILNGQQAFGKAVLEALLNREEEVIGIYCAPDIEGRPVDPLKGFAQEKGLPVYQPALFHQEAVQEQIRSLNADLCVMAYVTAFVPEKVLNTPTLGTIQYHPSLLPMHKGPSSINWPIIFGEKKTGLSIFWPDKGLDTGPLLMQKTVGIGPDDTLGSLYFNYLFPLGVEAMLEAVDLVREGKAPKEPQDPSAGTYEGWCRIADAEIDWRQSVETIYNLIRGTNPQPGAWTTFNGDKLHIFDCIRIAGKGDDPGRVIEVNDAGITVSTNNGLIQVQRVRPLGDAKIAAGEFAKKHGLDEGGQFG